MKDDKGKEPATTDEISPYEQPESMEVNILKIKIQEAIGSYLEFINPDPPVLRHQLIDFFREFKWHGKQGRENAMQLRNKLETLHTKYDVLVEIFNYPGYYLKEQLTAILKRELQVEDKEINEEVGRHVRTLESGTPGIYESCVNGIIKKKLKKEKEQERIHAGLKAGAPSAAH
jgi:hypothetical protein